MCEMQIRPGASLRLLGDGDADELHALIEVNRDELVPWLPWAAAQTHADTADFIRKAGIQVSGNDGFQGAIVCAGQIAGVIGFHSVDWSNRSTSIGYWLAREWQGRGLMTSALRLLTDHALSTWELNRVEVEAAIHNVRSRALPERLGFREEGVRRQAELVGGRYLDSVLYATLAGDWRESRR